MSKRLKNFKFSEKLPFPKSRKGNPTSKNTSCAETLFTAVENNRFMHYNTIPALSGAR